MTNSSTRPPLVISCPRCAKLVQWTMDYPYRPFCSERCKLIDLGEWAAEEKIIPGESLSSENENEDAGYYQ